MSYCFKNKQTKSINLLLITFRLPSAVMRNRLHDEQKLFVIDVMKPI